VLPLTPTGITLALADRFDTLAGIFAIGQRPTGTRDPFALRRAAIGVLRILLERRLPVDLPQTIGAALRLQPVSNAAAGTELLEFFMERLRAQLLESADAPGVSTEMFNAVQAGGPVTAPDVLVRLQALAGFLQRPGSGSLTAANKRIANILRKSAAGTAHTVDPGLLTLPQEQALASALANAVPDVDAALARADYAAALNRLADLGGTVDAFFEGVLVNDPDARLRDNRLALLAQLRGQFARIADLSLLPG
jgi:glycyl-tRNA synthetase beta chain